MPHIDSISPEGGPVHTPVSISGSDFGIADFSSSFKVRFGKSVAIGDPWSNNEVLALAPSDYGTGINSRRTLSCVLIITGGQVASYLAEQGISIIGLSLQQILEHLGTNLGPVFGDFLLPESCTDALASLALDGIDLAPQSGTVTVPLTVVTPAGESNAASFTYQVPSLVMAQLHSPGDLRVYDSEGRVTGMVNGIAKEEIPLSLYDEEDKTVMIPSAFDMYRFEVLGTGDGTYGLDIASSSASGRTIFRASGIPTEPGIDHRYSINWQTLAARGDGVELEVDTNGDGVFERVITADSTLTAEEFALETAAVIDFVPDTLNLQSKGKVVTAYIELPPGFNVVDIDLATIRLNGTIPALTKPTAIGDNDADGIADLMVKFDGAAVRSLLAGERSERIVVSGRILRSGGYINFSGTDFLKLVK